MFARLLAVGFLAQLLAPLSAQAAPGPGAQSASAGARTVILRPITVAATAELSFGRLVYAGNGLVGTLILPAKPPSTRVAVRVNLLLNGGETPLIRSITGEPSRIYRVGLPTSVRTTSGDLLVSAFTLWSSTQGDVSKTRLGAFNAQGSDTLRLGATLTVPKGTRQGIYAALVPVTISYE